MVFADGGGLPVEFFEFLAFGVERFLAIGAVHLLGFDGGETPFTLLGGLGGIAVQALQFEARHGDAGVGAGEILTQLADVVIEGDAVLFARLLQGAQPFHIAFQGGDLAAQPFLAGQTLIESTLAALELDAQLASFAFHGQRPGAGFLAAGDGMTVIAEAFGEEEVEVRIARGETLRGGAIFRQEA